MSHSHQATMTQDMTLTFSAFKPDHSHDLDITLSLSPVPNSDRKNPLQILHTHNAANEKSKGTGYTGIGRSYGTGRHEGKERDGKTAAGRRWCGQRRGKGGVAS